MKWIGQHIWDLISRFRGPVYFEKLETSSQTNVLVVDSDGKVTKNSAAAGDITEVVAGNGISGGGAGPGAVTVSANTGAGLENYVAAYGSYSANHTQVNLSQGILVNQPVGSGGTGMLQQGTSNKIDQWTDITALTVGGLTKLLRNDGFGTLSTGGAINDNTNSYTDIVYFNPTNGGKSLLGMNVSWIKSLDGDYASGSLNFKGVQSSFIDFGDNTGGTVNATGVVSQVIGTTSGTTHGIGVDVDVTGSDTNDGVVITTTDGGNGFDLKITSSADANDYFGITTIANGATTLKTNEDGVGSGANLVLDVDGDIELNADGGVIAFKDNTAQLAKISAAGLSFVDNTGAGIVFEGTTDDAYNTTLTAADTTSSSKTITLPNATGTVALTSSADGLTKQLLSCKQSTTSLFYTYSSSTWYPPTGVFTINYGTGSTPNTAATGAILQQQVNTPLVVAISDMKIYKVLMNWRWYSKVGATLGDRPFEFSFHTSAPPNDSTAEQTLSTALSVTDNDTNYTNDKQYLTTWEIDSGNGVSLPAGQALNMFARMTAPAGTPNAITQGQIWLEYKII